MSDKMFCPKCGNADQLPETFCRRCGSFLPDLSKSLKKRQGPEDHIKANTVLSALTIGVSFTLAALLYIFLGFRPETHPLIYATAGFLIAIGAWHIQTLWRSILLKRHFQKKGIAATAETQGVLPAASTDKFLQQADAANIVPASVTERTTRNLTETKQR